jgi:Glycosyl transferase family 2
VSVVTLAIPCRTDEPELGHTLAAAWTSWQAAAGGRALELLVCLNGRDPATSPALRDLDAFVRSTGGVPAVVDADADAGAPPPLAGPLTGIAMTTRREGKAIAWNLLRAAARGEVVVFLDADVAFAGDTFGRLLGLLAAHPDAVLASPKTTCAPRPTAFERIMAAPYGIDFPNLSGQLYAARRDGLPPTMPEDLIEPERWLELVVGAAHVVRDPAARVVVRLPGTLGDFFRQRIRIEMGKVQLQREYPALEARGATQPRLWAALAQLGLGDLARLGVYLGMREVCYAIARRRFHQGRTAGIWRQASSTKRWGAA